MADTILLNTGYSYNNVYQERKSVFIADWYHNSNYTPYGSSDRFLPAKVTKATANTGGYSNLILS